MNSWRARLGICLLHDLMLAYKLIRVDLRFLDHIVRLRLCVGKDRVLICNDLLITLDLIHGSDKS